MTPPLPLLPAQKAMRSKLGGITTALMMCTMLHSIAVGNLLPAHVKTICVDINPSVVTKPRRPRHLPGHRPGHRHRTLPGKVSILTIETE
jgi:hypothetical protein